MTEELAKVYEPGAVESAAYGLWQARGSFAANAEGTGESIRL